MKPFKFGLRIWITISSLMVFLVSWVMLGHSPKPVGSQTGYPASYVAPLPTLEPLPSVQGNDTKKPWSSFFSIFNSNPTPRRQTFRTGGS
jgi:hypothetical protein